MNILPIIIENPATKSVLVDIIVWLVKISSSVALGVVLFTVLLKLITLPFDFISRFSMRKNSVKMEEMRPELEKLQRQYADNKDLYNQKMMALYKKNGYSMLGGCLPTIITLVIFFIAIAAFNNYSSYQNVKYYYDMSVSYNSVIYSGLDFDKDSEYIYLDEEGSLVVEDAKLYNLSSPLNLTDANGKTFTVSVNNHGDYYTLNTGSYIEYKRYYTLDNNVAKFTVKPTFSVIESGLESNTALLNAENKTYAEVKGGDITALDFVKGICEKKAGETFRNNGSGFLWVKNIWLPDRAKSHPVSEEVFKTNSGSCSACSSCYKDYGTIDTDVFNELTADLEKEKTQPNGYYILVILTAASSFLMQLITSKSQKAQMELQTVDGQGAQQQKMMMWMLPIMMAFFSFLYTAAFSIYIILSSIISVGTTFAINKLVDKKYKNNGNTQNQVIRGRVYEKKEEPKKQEKKVSKKDKIEGPDFLNSKSENKKFIRGRKK